VLVLVDELPEGNPTEEEDMLVERETARQALAELSPTERRLLSLAYLQGWTAREIAEADGIPLGTVKTRLRTSLIKLRKAQGERDRLAAALREAEVE
jgi:RNA polymerase sigma-70 factor (ECF subfamily)